VKRRNGEQRVLLIKIWKRAVEKS